MDSRSPGTRTLAGSPAYLDSAVRYLAKIVIAGGMGVGKTTLIRSVSEIPVQSTEEVMTAASVPVDSLALTPGKSTTTVALDFGRRAIDGETVLYLFGAPGQSRFIDSLWPDLSRGAQGVLVLVDLRRLEDSYPFFDRVERDGLPYAVAVNTFPNTPAVAPEDLRTALDLDPATPLVICNALDSISCLDALIAVVKTALSQACLDRVS